MWCETTLMNRREALKLATLSIGTGIGIAGCSGQQGNQGGDGGGGGGGGGGSGSKSLLSKEDWNFVDWNKPKPITERLTAGKPEAWTASNGPKTVEGVRGPKLSVGWIPPEYDKKQVASSISHTNSGGVSGDPATVWTNMMFEEHTGIKVNLIEVPSPRLKQKTLTPLSSKSKKPVLFNINRQMYMDFVEPGWLEPLDNYWHETDGVLDIMPDLYGKDGGFTTGLDSSMEGEHVYAGHYTSQGHFMHYRPDVLEELGFDPNLFNGVKTDYDWSDCYEVFKAAKEQKDMYGFVWVGKTPRHAVRWWITDVLAQGGKIVQEDGTVVFNSKEGREAARWEQKLVQEGLTPNILEMAQGAAIDSFLSGDTLAITHGGKVRASALEALGPEGEKYAMGLPPKADRGPDPWHATLQVEGLFIVNRFAPPEKKKAALLYLDAQSAAVSHVQEFVMEGNMASNTKAFNALQSRTKYADVLRRWAEIAVEPLWPRQLQTQNALAVELQRVWGGEKDVKPALEDAQAKVDKILNQDVS